MATQQSDVVRAIIVTSHALNMNSHLVYNIFVCSLMLLVAILSQQMLLKAVTRLFHYHRPTFAAEKSNLALLRKKTGYTFANCKKALELHDNNAEQVTLANRLRLPKCALHSR